MKLVAAFLVGLAVGLAVRLAAETEPDRRDIEYLRWPGPPL